MQPQFDSVCLNTPYLTGFSSSQKILPGSQGPNSQPKEDDDDASHDEQHDKGDGDTNEGGSVQTEALGDGVEVDHHLILVILRQLKLNIRWRNNLKKITLEI